MPDDEALDRDRLEPVFADDFDGDTLDAAALGGALPPAVDDAGPVRRRGSRPVDGGLTLRIDADQPAWRPQDGPMRVSNLQTGTFSGPAGSGIGQHRHRPGLSVVTPQPTRRLWTPSSGRVEATMRAPGDPTCMLALWLVGLEESPEASGEICVAELFGDASGREAPGCGSASRPTTTRR